MKKFNELMDTLFDLSDKYEFFRTDGKELAGFKVYKLPPGNGHPPWAIVRSA